MRLSGSPARASCAAPLFRAWRTVGGSSLSDCFKVMKALRLIGHGQSFNQLVQVSVKDLVQLIECDPDSVIGQTILWKIVRSYAFGSVSGSDLAPPFRSHSVVLFLHFQVVELRTELA